MLTLTLLFILAAVDRLTKLAALQHATTTSPSGEVFVFQVSANTGGILALPIPHEVLVVLTVLLGIVFVVLAVTQRGVREQLGYGAIALGIFSNGYDRLTLGYVVDTFRLLNSLSFNLADLFIIGGVALVGWSLLRDHRAASSPPTLEPSNHTG